jgi:hypothetical protein
MNSTTQIGIEAKLRESLSHIDAWRRDPGKNIRLLETARKSASEAAEWLRVAIEEMEDAESEVNNGQ